MKTNRNTKEQKKQMLAETNGKHYVYLHRKADTGEIFYVGEGIRGRLFEESGRNKHWTNTAEKHGFVVEIAKSGFVSITEALAHEVEMIALCKKQGIPLVNLTDGGEGSLKTEQTDKNKENIMLFYKTNERLPSSHAKALNEKRLGTLLTAYCAKTHRCFDPEFNTWARDAGYGYNAASDKKQEIRDFYSRTGRIPSKRSQDPCERKLGASFSSYCCPKHGSFDLEFNAWAREIGFGKKTSPEKKEKCRAFYEEKGRLPGQYSKDPEERQLGKALSCYCSAGDCFDTEFNTWARNLGYGQRNKIVR